MTPAPDPWTIIEERALRENIPLRGIIELTYRCNFGCVFCYLGEARKQPAMLDRPQCAILFENLRRAGTLVLTFTGGEPFLVPGFADILADARAARFAVRVFTNGSLVGADEAAMLKAVRPLSVDVSLYGASETSYRAITGAAGNFEAVRQGLEHLKTAGLPTVIKIVANRHNLDEIDAMLALADGLGAKNVITPLITPTDCGDTAPCSLMLDRADMDDYFRRYMPPAVPVPHGADNLVCTCGRNAFVIAPNGDVYPCIQVREAVGNALTAEFKTFWNKQPRPLLETVRGLTFGDLEGCAGCADIEYCFICPGLSKLASGRLTGKDPTACAFAAIRHRTALDR